MTWVSTLVRRSLLIALLVLAIVAVSGCSEDPRRPNTAVLAQVVPPVVPQAPVFDTPVEAIESYTDWISFAYRVLDSTVATDTFSANEEVNVDSYVQYNLMENRGIEQSLQKSDYKVAKSTPTSATVIGSEYWLYRYVAVDDSKYLTGPLEASYDVTYTVLKQPDGRWLVDKVEVNRLDKEDEPEGGAK